MPPKRRAGTQGVPLASKKAKSPSPTPKATPPDAVDTDSGTRESTGQGGPSEVAQSVGVPLKDMVAIDWALPTQADNKTRDESDAVTQFAPLFSGRPWTQTRTSRSPFHRSPLRSPSYRRSGVPEKKAGFGPNASSHCLTRLFNRIKHATESDKAGSATTFYSRTVFESAFETNSEHFVVVASASVVNPVQSLNGDYQVNV